MGFRNGAYAKVWEVRPNRSGRSTSVRLSISKKAADGQYEEDFSGWVMFCVKANERAKTLKDGDRIKLGDVDVSSAYNKETKQSTYSFKAFTFEPDDEGGRSNGKTGAKSNTKVKAKPDDDDDELPDDLPF